MSTDLDRQVEAHLAQLRKRWNTLDLADIASLWDTENETPVYLPEESPEPLITWDAIEAYWQRTVDTISGLHMRTWDLSVRPVGDGILSVLYQMHWDAQMRATGVAIGGRNRVSALLRRSPEGLRFIQYVEAPLAPMVYMNWLYQRAVDFDFQASSGPAEPAPNG